MPIRDSETFFNVRVTKADGTVEDHLYKSSKEAARLEREVIAEKGQLDVTKAQAFVVTTAESLADISTIIPDQTVALAVCNYGIKLYQQTLRSRHMKDPDWRGGEIECDLILELQQIKAKLPRTKTFDEFTATRRAIKKAFARKHPDAEMPSDERIDALLKEIFERQGQAPEIAA